jgi:hypothetical protein
MTLKVNTPGDSDGLKLPPPPEQFGQTPPGGVPGRLIEMARLK